MTVLNFEDKITKKLNKKKKSKGLVNGSKSAQIIFKTALRNHIDLTSIADNKANIILSINAIIITIAIPLFSTYVAGNSHLIIPAVLLVITSLLCIIYGALVTRPIKMAGFTDLSKLKAGRSNLFFFGNFYNMEIDDYRKGVQEIINDERLLDNTITTDLYYLGQALGKKYELLRKCYSFFMVGMSLTVISFGISFFF